LGKLFGFLLVIVLLAGAVAGGGWFWLNGIYTGEGPATEDGKPRAVVIERGASTPAIATALRNAGAITDADQFRLALRVREFMGDKPVMKAGEYEIDSGASMEGIVEQLSTGSPLQYAVIVPEGLSTIQILEMLAAREWKATGGSTLTYKLAGDLPEQVAEGVLLPGDYAVSRGDTVASVVDRMKKAQTDLLDELWDKRSPDLPVSTREDAIKLASVVERETGNSDEQPQVAAVFENRLKIGMPLQADSTTVYGITKGKPLGRSITRKDLDTKTPWNTYQISGLPETPICNPGAGAIRATLNPAESKAIYFVADGTGAHVFAETYAEHQRNVDAYWKLRKQNEAAGVNTPAVRPQR
jgi:UPF0755 protein